MDALWSYQNEPKEIPLCFIVNSRSGGKEGEALLETFSRFPHCSVFDIQQLWGIEKGECDSEVLSSFMKVIQMDGVRVVAGGGDGTVSFVCSLLDFLHFKHNPLSDSNHKELAPPVAILPIGVGNELSRCIGWSSGFSPSQSNLCCLPMKDLEWDFINKVKKGSMIDLDRWQISFEANEEGMLTPALDDISWDSKSGRFSMLCFFSIGFDASISHNFHLLREKDPSLTSSVAMNKWWYTYYGIRELFKPTDTVSSYLDLTVDGKPIKLPPSIRTLQIFNIHSSADGVDFFGISKKSSSTELQAYEQPCLHDGLLEVVGTEGVHHLLAIRSGLSHSWRIAQGSEIIVTLKRPLPVQLDGEAWIQHPSTVAISFGRTARVICGNGTTRGIIK